MQNAKTEACKSFKPKIQKLEYLDSIRGIVAIGVVLHHSFFGFDSNLGQNAGFNIFTEDWIKEIPLIHYLINGQLHVTTFFVLSGRVVANSYYII